MKKVRILLGLVLLSITSISSGQEDIVKVSDSLLQEGTSLYKSEMASWYGTDMFLEKYKNRENIGGYFSYSEVNITKCIFFSKSSAPRVIGTVSFDSSYNLQNAQVDLTERDFTNIENELYTIRTLALKAINGDTLFKVYKNTNLNLIPVISNGQRKMYVLTGPEENGVVIFGNDYLISFNEHNELVSKKQLHRNIISVDFSGDTSIAGTMHTHLPETGDFITATDICTLMLYEKFAKWQQHIVLSHNYVSVWDCSKNNLAILTKQAWDNLSKDQKKRHKNN